MSDVKRMAAAILLGEMLAAIQRPSHDPEKPDLAGDFEPFGETGIAAKVTTGSGDSYRIAVEWLPEESP